MSDTLFPPTRDAALSRLAEFVPEAGIAYARNRGRDVPGHANVSRLSPYLRHRAVTEAEVARAVLDAHGPEAAASLLSEIAWRSYFKGWLERRPSIWTDYQAGLSAARNQLATASGLRRAWADACEGNTGIAPFDDWARELVETGYLHNHARMWFASIWMHTLRLPWQLGADFFLRHLLDGDPASNTLSWRWVAGLQTRGKVYAARADVISDLTGGRFDAVTLAAQLTPADQVEALDGPPHPDPIPVPNDIELPRGRIGLLLHEDDLYPDFLLARGLEPQGCAALIAPSGRSPLIVSDRVTFFVTELAQDVVSRLPNPGPVTEDTAEIAAWAKGFDHIVTSYAPVGPLRTALDSSRVATHRPLRAWDAAAWPHTEAGYFKLKTKIPDILATIPQDMVAGPLRASQV